MNALPAAADDWPRLLRAAFEKAGRKPPVDFVELLTSPEAMAAYGLTTALLRISDDLHDRRLIAEAVAKSELVSRWDNGHGGEDGPRDLHATRLPALHVDAFRASPAWRIRLLDRYCKWRISGEPVTALPRDVENLDARLAAVANVAAPHEIHTLVSDLGEARATRAVRLAEYYAIGSSLLAEDQSLARLTRGPADGPGLPQRSWHIEPQDDDLEPSPTPDDAPSSPSSL